MLVFCLDFSLARKVGAFLNGLILVGALIEILITAPLGAQLFADERRNNTLGLIFSTGITGTEVLIGKLAALLIVPLSRLLTLVPCLMILPLMRAVTPQTCVAMIITILVLLALVLGIHLFASLIFEELSSARTFADLFILLLLGFAPAVNFLNSYFAGAPLDRLWLCLSPAYAPWVLFQIPTPHELTYVYLSNLTSAVVAALLFIASAVIVARVWREQTTGTTTPLAINLFSTFRNRRRRLARPLLDASPYQWLIYRDFRPMLTSTIFLGTIAIIWLLGLWNWGTAWLVPLNFWATLLLIGISIRWMTNYIACKQIGLDRSSGTLELLLTSPLHVGDIISGQENALRKYVRPLFFSIAALHLLFFILGLIFHPLSPSALRNYILIAFIVAVLGPWFNFQQHWNSFWIALNTGRPGFAMRQHLWQKGAYFWIYFQIFIHRDKLSNIPSGSLAETIVISIAIAGLILGYFLYRVGWTSDWQAYVKIRNLSIEHMRPIAAEPLPDINDPRVKKWNTKEPLFHPPPENEKILV